MYIEELYQMMSEAQYLNPDMDIKTFSKSLETEEGRKSLYNFLDKQGSADIEFKEFDTNILADFSKKKDGTMDSGANSSEPSSSSNAPIVEPATPGELIEPTRQESTRTDFVEKGLAIPNYTGEEDPFEAGAAIRDRIEAPKKRVLESDIKKGNRELEDLVLYAKELNIQSRLAKEGLADQFGEDWESKMEEAMKVMDGDVSNPQFANYKQFVSEVRESKHFESLIKAGSGLDKSQSAFADYSKNNPEYAKDVEAANKAQIAADESTLSNDPYFLNKRLMGWYARKTADVAAGFLSMPRTMASGLPFKGDGVGFEDYIGGIADLAVEKTNLYLPTQTENNRALWENVADVNIGGENYTAVVNNDEVVRVYAKNSSGNMVEVSPDDDTMALLQEQAPSKAESRFTGWENTGAKALDVATDLIIMRAVGGGSSARAGIVSFAQQHNDFYKEAMEDMNMSSADAAEYALTAGAINAFIEAGIGNLESRPLTAAGKIGQTETKALTGLLPPTEYARKWAKDKGVGLGKDILSENTEEIMQSLAENATKAEFNRMTGASMDVGMSADEIKETILLTTLVTAPISMLGGGGDITSYQKSSLSAAVNAPEKFKKTLDILVEDGGLDQSAADMAFAKVSQLASKRLNLPNEISEGAKDEVVVLEHSKEILEDLSNAEGVTDAQKEVAKEKIAEIDNLTKSIIEEKTDDSVEEKTNPFSFSVKINEPVSPTVEKKDVSEAVTRSERTGTPVVSSLSEVVTDSETPFQVIIDTIENTKDRLDENRAGIVIDNYIDEISQSVYDEANRVREVSNEDIPVIRKMVQEAILENPSGTYTDVVSALSGKFLADDTIQGNLSQKLDVGSAMDDIADFFVSGGRLAREGADWMMSEGVQKDSKGMMLKYFSGKSEMRSDQLAQQISDRWGITESEAQQMIADFIQDNPSGPGQYVKSRIDEDINEDEQEVDSFFDQFKGRDGIDYDAAAESIKNNAPEYEKLPESAKGLINEAIGTIPKDEGEPVSSDQSDAEENKQETKGEDSGSPIGDTPETIEGKEDTSKETAADLEAAINNLPVNQETAIVDLNALQATGADPDLIKAVTQLMTDGTPLTEEQTSEVKKARLMDTTTDYTGVTPFQRDIPSNTNDAINYEAVRINRGRGNVISKVVNRLSKAFPNIKIVTNKAEVRKALKEFGISSENVKGFVKDGTVYINMDRAGIDTPIHELGHIWASWAREENPTAYKKGLQLVKDTAYHQAVKDSPFYSELNEEQQLEESLAIAIGERGALMETSSLWAKFKAWLSELWGEAERRLGFDPSTTTLSGFTTKINKDLFSGEEVASITAREIISIREKMASHPVYIDGQFQFVGTSADLSKQVYGKLALAKSMVDKDPDTVWAATGWFKGVDGMWRYEINTDQIHIKTPWPEMAHKIAVQDGRLDESQDVTEATFILKELVDHPTLFSAYPQLKDMRVRYSSGIEHGSLEITESGQLLTISTKTPFSKEVLVHEIQHAIQNIEAFATGTNPDAAAYIGTHLISKAVSIYEEAETKEEQNAALEMLKGLQEYIINGTSIDGLALYKASAGEVEARLAGARATKMVQSPGFTLEGGDPITYKGLEYYYTAPWFNKDTQIFETPEDVKSAMDGNPVRIASREDIPPYTMYDVAPEHQVVFTLTDEKTTIISHPGTTAFQIDSANKIVDESQKSARLIIEKEIKKNGQKNRDAVIEKIAKSFNLDTNNLNEVWAQESEAVTFSEPAFKPEKVTTRISKWMKKYFTSNGLLGPEIMNEVRSFEKRTSAHVKGIDLLLKDFDRAVESEAKDFDNKEKGRKHFRKIADAVLKGEATPEDLPESVREPVIEMRNLVDQMSREIVKVGAGNNKFMMTILQNSGVDLGLATGNEKSEVAKALATNPNDRTMDQNILIQNFLEEYGTEAGTYLYRSYQVNDDKNWKSKVDRGVVERAKTRIINDINERISELEDIRDTQIDSLEAKVESEKDRIGSIIEVLKDQMEVVENKLSDLITKQSGYRREKGRSNKSISRQIESARKVLLEIKTRLRQSNNIASEDIHTLMVMPTEELNALRMTARTIAGARRRIQKMEEKIQAVKDFSPDTITELESRKENIDSLIDEILDRPDAPTGLLAKGLPGSKDLSSFNKRKEIPEEVRALMGEYKDARINFAKSATRMAHLIESQQLLLRLRNQYEGQFFFPPETPVPGFYRKISSDGSKAMSPLNGWYTSPDIANELSEIYDQSSKGWPTWLKAWFGIVSSVRYGKTILSPVTHIRNVVSNLYLGAIHGHFDITKPTKGFGLKDASIAIAGKFSKLESEERRSEVIKLTRLGILGSGTSSEILKDGLEEMTSFTDDWAVTGQKLSDMAAGSKIEQLMAGSVKAVGKSMKIAEEMYQIEDDFFKALGFYKEQSRYAKAWYGKKYNDLSPQEREIVDDYSANLVQNILPTYDRVPKIVSTFLRGWPLTGTFVAFPAEMFRTSKNTIYLIRDELKDSRTRSIGFTRLASTIGWQATIFAAAYYMRTMNNVDDEEDIAIRAFSKPWLKDATLIHQGENNGIYSFYNLSYTDPHSFFKEFYWTMSKDTDKQIHERLGTAFTNIFDPFISENLVWGTARQAISNQNDYNHADIYNTALSWKEWLPVTVDSQGVRAGANFSDLARFLKWSLQPGIMKTEEDLEMAITGESISGRSPKSITQVLSSFAGLQKEEFDPVKQVSSHIRLRGQQRRDARNAFNSAVKEVESQIKRGLVKNPSEKLDYIKSSFDISVSATSQLSEVILSDIDKARRLGVSNKQLNESLKDAGFTVEERTLLLTGNEFTPKFKGFNK